MLDYTRHLLPGTQGRSNSFRHALLEFVIKNDKLFLKYKETKVRYLMRKVNFYKFMASSRQRKYTNIPMDFTNYAFRKVDSIARSFIGSKQQAPALALSLP